MTLAELALVVLSLPVLGPCVYLLAMTLLSARPKAPAYGAPKRRFELVVPAHDEEGGIAGTVESLTRLDYPAELRRITVVADNCQDATAERAAAAGARVLKRTDPVQRGKGYALALGFEQVLREGWAEAAVVIDADTVASPNLLLAFAARLDSGAGAVQADYAVRNARASWRTRLMAVAFSLFHVVRSTARERLGLSCGLRGNGMCFSADLLRQHPHDAFSIVEDVEYGVRLGRGGVRVHYAGEAHVWGDMVASEEASRSQRRRWEGGRWALARKLGVPLLWDGVRRRSGVSVDLALDLLTPPLSWLATLAVVGLGCAVGLSVRAGAPSAALWPWALACGCLFLHGLRGWQLSGIGLRGVFDLLRVPFYILWKLTLPFRRKDAPSGAWVRTRRQGETSSWKALD